MSSLKQNDIVLITGASSDDPADSAYINLFGKIKEKKLKNVEVFIDIQGKTAKYDSIYLKKIVDQKLGETVFMLQSLTSDHLKNALQFCTFTDLFNMYCLGNPYINDAFNGREGIKIDFRNDYRDDKLRIFPKYKQFYSTQNRISIVFDELINLQKIEFEREFNQKLGKSLHGLNNLKEIHFGYDFNKPLEDSLNGLENLQKLYLGGRFNQPLEDSLNSLEDLQELYFGCYFNQPLEDSLRGLDNLRILDLGMCFDISLNDSLHGLNLQELYLSYYFNQPLEDSLYYLHSLKILRFGFEFNQPLEDSLYELINLEELHFNGIFNQPLKDTLHYCWNLKILKIGVYFDPKIDREKEEKRYASDCYDNGGETLSFDSFKNCKSLETITFPDYFEGSLSVSLVNDFKNHDININFFYCQW